MHIRNLILTIFTTFAVVLMLAVSLPVYSQELANQDTLIAVDSLAVDTIMNNDPEWYVAPMTHDLARAPFRTPAAACPIDSVRTFNVDSVLESVSVYEYGDTTRTMIWTVNSDGSRYGSGREESGTNGDVTFSASYEWDITTNDWKGKAKEEHTYTGGKETLRTIYTWINNTWIPDSKYTWTYDAAGRETEYTTYTRNTTTNELVPSKQRLREYNAAGKTMLDIQYTAHNGTNWSAGTKRIYDYDGNNTILDEYYSSYTNSSWEGSVKKVWEYTAGKNTYYEQFGWSNGAWVSSYKENWIYTAGNKTYYEKNTWSNNAWVGTTKEIWAYFNDNSKKQSLHKKYGWANGDWAISQCDSSVYDAAGNNTLVENYTYTNGVQKGSKKEEYTYSGSTKIATITYKWSNNAWVYDVWTVSDMVSVPSESCRYVWTNVAWVGNGNRTLTTNNSSNKPIEVLTQTWSADAGDWVNYRCDSTKYEGSKTIQEASYIWQNDAWVGATRSDWHYNAKGQNDTIKTYTNNGSEWIYSNRTVNTFNVAGANIMTHKAQWNGEKWVMTSMTRTDILDHMVDGARQTLNASWRCGADSVWIGVQKDSTAYTASGKTLYRIHCEGWLNNDWKPKYKIEYEYDDAERTLVQQQLDWVSDAWKGFYRYEWSFDAEGRQVAYASYNGWNTLTKNWVGTSKTETVYGDNGQVAESSRYTWSNNDWQHTQRYLYSYDGQNRTIQYVFQLYTNGAWVNSLKNETDYKGDEICKDNSYIWLNNQWVYSSRNESYYDDDEQAKLRRQVTGSWSNGVVSYFADDHYHYACDPKLAFTIRFENEDGTLLESKEVVSGTVTTYDGETPTKDGNEQYSYTFKGWDKTIVPATADATYTAEYDSVVNRYRITWFNADDVEVAADSLAYGAMPSHEDLVKTLGTRYYFSNR